MGLIYKISGPYDNPDEIIKNYVGQTKQTLKRRWNSHKTKNKAYIATGKGISLHKILSDFGIDNFKIYQLEECEDALLNEREIHWINELNTVKPNGYNLQSGGSNCTQHQETKDKMSQSRQKGSSVGLPTYISYYETDTLHGYRVRYRQTNKRKIFAVDKSIPITEALLDNAKRYLKSCVDTYQRSISSNPESLPVPEVVPDFGHKRLEKSQGLPKYINFIETKIDGIVTRHGYKVNYQPAKKTRIITCDIKTLLSESMLTQAKAFLAEIITNYEEKLIDDQKLIDDLSNIKI